MSQTKKPKRDNAHSLKVLVVDDVASQRKSVKGFIEKNYRLQVSEAEDGYDAIQRTIEDDFDLVISDLVMPNMNGLELCAFLKSSSTYRQRPFVMLSSIDDERTINQAKTLGASQYLIKPFKAEDVGQILDQLLQNKD
jgi:PleD family two-component response regulator